MISVIIPTFNRPKQLLRAVESVLQQTYRDFELLVIDDGSTANLQHIAELVRDKGHRFLRIDNQGVAHARNYGVSQSRGKWISFLDSDDCWKPNKLDQQANFHLNFPSFRISQCEEVWIRKGKLVNKKKHYQMPEGEAFENSLKLCCISPSSVMLEKDLFKKKGGFDKRFTVCEDYDLWLRITLDNQVGLVKQKSVEKYGGHEDQLSKSQPAMDRFRVFALLKLIMNFDLESDKLTAALAETKRKANILLKGAIKRNLEMAEIFKKVEYNINKAFEDSLSIHQTRDLLVNVYTDVNKIALIKDFPVA